MEKFYAFVQSRIGLVCLCLFLSAFPASSQDAAPVPKISFRTLQQVNQQAVNAYEELAKMTSGQLDKLEKREMRLYKKVLRIDSAAARRIFKDVRSRYEQLRKCLAAGNRSHLIQDKVYLPVLDSLEAAFSFLHEGTSYKAAEICSGKLGELTAKFSAGEQVQQFLRERKSYLTEQLKPFGKLRQLLPFQKEVYYFQRQLADLKESFHHSSRAQQKILALLNELPSFNTYFARHSQLAGLFQLPVSNAAIISPPAGSLQTRSSVMGQVTATLGTQTAVNDLLKQNLNQAQSMVNQLKDKINQFGSGGHSDLEMPDFKVNGQRTKSFLQRVELGMNVQSQKGSQFLPVSSDIGISAGYKLNDKSIIGIGASYKMGWGKGLQDISLTSEGAGLRSFIELKLKGSLWLAGGSEFNYRNRFKSIAALKDHSGWQQSALVGLSKKFGSGKKIKANFQLLYDFLYQQQVPQTQPVIFRIGYRFK